MQHNEVTQEKTDILFVFLPGREPGFCHHLGIAYIQAFLKTKGIKSHFYVPKELNSLNDLVNNFLSYNPKVIGFASYDDNYYCLRTILPELKKIKKDIKIIVGGPTSTFSYELLLKNRPEIDVCVRYEGEQTTYELLTKWKTKEDLKTIRGISFLDQGKVVSTPDRALARGHDSGSELDVLPSPYIEGILEGTEEAGIITSRGCFHKCVYCNFAAMSKKTLRFHSVDRVIEELKTIYKKVKDSDNDRLRVIHLWDDALSLNKERAKDLCRRIIDENFPFVFDTELRAESTDAELLSLMKKANFEIVNFGLESAVPRILRNIKKISDLPDRSSYKPEEFFLEKLKENVKIAREMGFKINVSFILGLPGETPEDAKATIDFVKDLGVDNCAHNYLHVLRGTELFKTHKQYGIKTIFSDENALLPDTQHSYDVFSIRYLENSDIVDRERVLLEHLLNFFEGEYSFEHEYYPILKKLNSFFILNLSGPPEEKILDWLKHNILYGSMIGIIFENSENGYFNETIKRIKKKGILSRTFIEVIDKNRWSSLRYNNTKQPFYTNKSISKINLSSFLDNDETNDKNRFIFLEISNDNDKNKFLHLIKGFNSNIRNETNKKLFDQRVHLINMCKWLGKPCNKVCVRRLQLNDTGEVTCCFNDKRNIGSIHENKNEIFKHLNDLYTKKQEARGCTSCKVRETCSKCLFPEPFTDEEYCKIRRSNPDISDNLLIINYFNSLRQS